MPSYELMFIVRPELDEEQVTTATDRVHQLVVANGGNVTKTAAWGKRRLAYNVGQYREGYYIVSNFDVESNKIAELERVLKISDTVFRHLLVKRDAPAIGQTEVVVPEATPEEIAAMYEPVVTEDEAEAAPPAVGEEEETALAEAPAAEPAEPEPAEEVPGEAEAALPAAVEAIEAPATEEAQPEAAPAAESQKEEASGHEPK